MAEELKLRTQATPSYINKDTLLGALIGSFVLTPLIGGTIGAAIGGYLGKERIERENTVGKDVSPTPSFWNKETLIGTLTGNLLGGIAASLLFVATTGLTLSAVAAGAPIAGATLGIGLAVAATAVIGGTIAGAYVGGKSGQARQTAEYSEAKQQNIVSDLSKNVSPQVAQAVEYAMENDKTKNWAQHIENERAMTQGQEKLR